MTAKNFLIKIFSVAKKGMFLTFICVFSSLNIFGQTHYVYGVVTSASNGQGMPGVSVSFKGSVQGTTTDIDGSYKIKTVDTSSTLVFSMIGFETYETKIEGKDTINVTLKLNDVQLSEVEVLGYGSVIKNDITGSVSIVGNKKNKSSHKTGNTVTMRGVGSINNGNSRYFNPSIEEYDKIQENGFHTAFSDPLSTFAIDVDRAAYSNIRRYLNLGQQVPTDAVRIEEMVNYFNYDYPQPKDDNPYSITTEYSECPWHEGFKLLHIGLQGKKIPVNNLPPSNIVFLLDVSGSMEEENKLPLVKSSMKLLVNNLRKNDLISIVVYAGAAGIVLQPTPGDQKTKIFEAIDNLQAGGSTAGGQGIELAYKTAEKNFIINGNNRIILCTDGDFNVGISNKNELEDLITKKRETGVYLTCLGFGMGNLKDNKIETLSDKGNGNYAYIDNIQEANKTLVTEFGGTLFTIAKDVKLQVEFNPAVVQAYRLIGYENRMLNNEDFKDDKKDQVKWEQGIQLQLFTKSFQ